MAARWNIPWQRISSATIVAIDSEIAFQKCSSGNCCTNSWSKIQQRTERGRACVASEAVSFFSSSTQTKLFYLTSPSFCVRDFSLTEQCSQPLTLNQRSRCSFEATFLLYVYTPKYNTGLSYRFSMML